MKKETTISQVDIDEKITSTISSQDQQQATKSNDTAITILRITAIVGLVAVIMCCGVDYRSKDGYELHISRARFIR